MKQTEKNGIVNNQRKTHILLNSGVLIEKRAAADVGCLIHRELTLYVKH